ncbi:LytTR family DNA-binding domain-containing protein [Terrisporobacter petrolearius]|uniref:LytR/AlgR family response regulator transcription factor n=1 Tax=Terrisporobacter petrolearius TaxID=1460447 RepID=UPI001D16C3A5|nr:LytTR family DNA-binding domain-containing protein [Terrisporobacter petrolearius]MCC3864423.1 LytTR family DNA-binding domain-containing protein [Terrisporobacter petrolearius]
MKVIIVDDEFPARKELRYFIEKYTKMEIVDEFDNGLDVLNFIQENTLNAIFLDINIPKLDGMLLAKTINKFERKPKIVFITAYDNYAVEAFNLDIFDYILKPYSDERIISMLDKLKTAILDDNCKDKVEYQKVSNKISLWKNDKIHIVDVNDIYYCEARERYTHIFTKDEEYEIRECISEVEKTINNDSFFRTHRSYLVNLEKIEEIIPWFNNTYILKLNKGKYEITVSRGRVKLFRQLMNI